MDRELFTSLTLTLDGCLDMLDVAAEAERLKEVGKPLRKVTMQDRAKAAHKLVAKAYAALENEED